jgi:hypothetical protein
MFFISLSFFTCYSKGWLQEILFEDLGVDSLESLEERCKQWAKFDESEDCVIDESEDCEIDKLDISEKGNEHNCTENFFTKLPNKNK